MFTVKRSTTGFHNSLSVTVIFKSDKHVAPEGAESLLNHGYLKNYFNGVMEVLIESHKDFQN